MDLLKFYNKVASRTGWVFVISNFIELKFIFENLRDASEKFGLMYQFEPWINHSHLAVSVSSMSVVAYDYHKRKGQNYSYLLRKIFGSL